MPKRMPKNLNDYVEPLVMNGLQGRMLRLPAPRRHNREILFIYGHHASLERIFGFAEALNRYGAVTVPDLPGFGGMQSFYRIGMKPSIDNLADYLAAFIKLRYKRRRLTIVSLSVGFAITTRMLQKYPELAERVDVLVSVAGFVHKDDFTFSPARHAFFRWGASLFSNRLPAWVVQRLALRPAFITFAYSLVADRHNKLADAGPEERARRIAFEVGLWRQNDIRTYMDVSVSMLKLDLCTAHVNLPVQHVTVEADHFFDHRIVEQHLRVIYSDCSIFRSKFRGHSPTIMATAKEVAPYFPPQLRTLLSST